jgi:hypothetical protein
MSNSPTKLPSSIAGYLLKKSTEGVWQRRYFETSGHFLTYYKSEKMTKLLAALALPQVGEIKYIGAVDDTKGTGAIFQLDLKDRQYVLRADSEENAKKWVEVLVQLRDSEVPSTPTTPVNSTPPAPGVSPSSSGNVTTPPPTPIGGGIVPTPGDEARFVKNHLNEGVSEGCCVIS